MQASTQKPSRGGLNHSLDRSRDQPKKWRKKLQLNVKLCEYSVVEAVGKEMGFKVTRSKKHQNECDIIWIDLVCSPEQLSKLRPWQWVNHFPGMHTLAKKTLLAWNLSRIATLFPGEYDFSPKTWVLPNEYKAFVD